MKDVVIRRARPADASEIARMANLLAAISTSASEAPARRGMTAETVLADIIDSDYGLACDVAEADGRVAGYSLHQTAYESAYAARGRYLSEIYVDEWARRRGIARALLRSLAQEAHRDGAGFLWWITLGKDAAAQKLYAEIADVADPVTAYAVTGEAFQKLLR